MAATVNRNFRFPDPARETRGFPGVSWPLDAFAGRRGCATSHRETRAELGLETRQGGRPGPGPGGAHPSEGIWPSGRRRRSGSLDEGTREDVDGGRSGRFVLVSSADIEPDDDAKTRAELGQKTLTIRVHRMASPAHDKAIAALLQDRQIWSFSTRKPAPKCSTCWSNAPIGIPPGSGNLKFGGSCGTCGAVRGAFP
jgi:hypothetical protein